MSIEYSRHERFTSYAATLKERFGSGLLSDLQPLQQWVVWRAELDREGKQKKVPYNPNHHRAHASVKVPKSWGSLDQALTALQSGKYSGIGFVRTPPVAFVDLDHSYDKTTGTITDPQAHEIVRTINSYTEVSPSGKGLHLLAYGNLPGKGIHTAIELHGQDRFTTITTNHLAGTPPTFAHRQAALDALYRRFAPPGATREDQNTRGVWEAERRSPNCPRKRRTILCCRNCCGGIRRAMPLLPTPILFWC